jgi:hypothetical protein
VTTKLGQTGYRRFENQTGTVSRSKGATVGEPVVSWVRGPWPGFQPDLDPSAADAGAASSCSNLLDVNGTLTQQQGFARVDSAHLPLGDTTPPSSTGEAEPVVGIFEGRTNSTQVVRKYALTADSGADGSGFFGHLYELASGVWTHRPCQTAAESYKGVAGDPAGTLADAAHFAAGDFTVFCGGVGGNLVSRFPGATSSANYEKLLNLGAVTTLGAQSVCASEERILVLNTLEGGTVFPGRLRWTTKGANAKFDPAQTGAGFADFNDFGSEGLAVRNIGPKIALYFVTGVQFIRRTGNTTDPFTKDYSTYERGLLGTHSVCSVGNWRHFGIFNDGWFFLDYNGNWTEVGLRQDGYRKWFNEFYNSLSWDNRKRITCEYEPSQKLIYIGWPQAGSTAVSGTSFGPTTVWIYDIKTDSVWPALDWPTQPNIIKAITEETASGTTWDAMTTTWDTTSDSWDSFGPRIGFKRLIHGTGGAVGSTNVGLVLQHSPLLRTRDNALPNYTYQMAQFDGGSTEKLKTVQRVYLSYTHQTSPTNINVNYMGNNGSLATGAVKQTKGAIGSKQVDFVSGQLTAHQISVGISGTVPVAVDGFGIALEPSEMTARRET